MDTAAIRGVIGIPTTGTISTKFWMSQLRLDTPKGWMVLPTEGMLTATARNQIAKATLESPAEWLFFMDSDMAFPERTLVRLLQDRQNIVGGTYCLRAARDGLNDIVAYDYRGFINGHHEYAPVNTDVLNYLLRNKAPLDGKPHIIPRDGGELRPVDGIGTGCLLIHRRVLEKVGKPWFEYDSGGGSEDLDFCRKAKAAGFKIYLDMGVQCLHYRPMGVSYLHLLSQAQMREQVKE